MLMAATDKPYRDQNTLDIVFAVSSILMLVSIVWMFMDDYNREFKTEQRTFRDVEAALAQRQALDQMPNFAEFEKAEEAVKQARDYRTPEELENTIAELRARLEKAKTKGATDRVAELEARLKSVEGTIDLVQAKKDKQEFLEAK